jgi:hypothetical protein
MTVNSNIALHDKLSNIGRTMPARCIVVKSTDKAVCLENIYTGDSAWFPKAALVNHDKRLSNSYVVATWFHSKATMEQYKVCNG